MFRIIVGLVVTMGISFSTTSIAFASPVSTGSAKDVAVSSKEIPQLNTTTFNGHVMSITDTHQGAGNSFNGQTPSAANHQQADTIQKELEGIHASVVNKHDGCTNLSNQNLSGKELGAGCYRFDSKAQLDAGSTLKFKGNADTQIVIYVLETLSVKGQMITEGVQACNVTIVTEDSAFIDTSSFIGNLITLGGIYATNSTVDGRFLSIGGSVNTTNSTVTPSHCATPQEPPVTPEPTPTPEQPVQPTEPTPVTTPPTVTRDRPQTPITRNRLPQCMKRSFKFVVRGSNLDRAVFKTRDGRFTKRSTNGRTISHTFRMRDLAPKQGLWVQVKVLRRNGAAKRFTVKVPRCKSKAVPAPKFTG